MSEEQTKQLSSRGKSRRERVEFARSRDILDVANELNMDLVRSGRDYRWKDHDSFVITPSKNLWKWYSRNQGGDVISLVEVMKEVGFNQAIDYLNDGRFKEFTAVEQVREEFSYYLKPYEQPFDAARSYLKDKRGLSDETIDFFLGQGVLAQANAKVNGSIEPVIVFKSVDFSGEIVGATLQGIEENWGKWPERGYVKNIVRNSDGITGMHVDIGQPNRLIFSESPIDLMSYYELHKANLQDVRLISMDGLKESVIGRHLSQLLLEVSGRPIGKTYEQLAESLQTAIDHDFFSDGKNADLITLAVDNDKGGRNLIRSLQKKGATVNVDIPILASSKAKRDWNEELQEPSTSVEEGRHLYHLDDQKQEVRYEGYFTLSEADRRLQALSEQGLLGIVSKQALQEADLPAVTQEAWIGYQQNETDQSPKTAEEQYYDWFEKMAVTVQEQLHLSSPPKLASELEAVIEPFIITDVDRLFARRLSLALDTQRVAPSQILSVYQAIEQLDQQISERIQEELLYEVPVVDSLSTVEKQDVPASIQASERIQELLGQVEELGQNAYFWVTEEDLGQPKEVVTQLDNWFSSGKADSTYKSDLFELAVGDYTYMIEFKDGSLSLQNMEEYVQYLSSRIEKLGADTVALELESVISDFNQMKGAITEAMDKELELITVNRNSLSEEPQKPKEKPLEINQEGDFDSEQNKKERINVSKGSLQPEAEGSAVPVPSDSTFEPAVTSHPTLSSRYLEFTTDSGYVSNVRDGYHVISRKELDKLNNFAPHIQEMARWYRDNLASSDILYVVQNGVETDIVRLTFEEKNFSHLTGIQPVEKNHSAAKTLNDFVEGRGHYNNILLANQDNTFKKLGVLPNLKAVLNPVSFYFDDLEEIKRFKRMDVSKAIKSDDKDILLAFRTVDGTSYPATLLKVKGGVKADIEAVEGKIILGIYRERAGQIEQIAINEEFVKDGGKAMFEVLKNQEYEESGQEITPENTAYVYTQIRQNGEVLQHGGLISMDHAESVVRSFREDGAIAFVSQKPLTKSEIAQRTAELLAKSPDLDRTRPYTLKESFVDVRGVRRKRSGNQESEVTSEMFTQVLDAVYNVGSPHDLSNVPEEFHGAWKHYFELSEASKGDFKHVIDKAVQEGLVLTESSFYQEWSQDRIYNENYHVRIQEVDNWPDGVQQPFNSSDLRAYEEFVTSLYKGNQGLGDNLKEAPKVTFDIYAPGGQLIKDKVSYDIGVETEPVSRLLGLGYRRLEGQSELALIDEAVLSQLENQKVNQEIATEANEPVVAYKEVPKENSPKQDTFTSPKQEMKAIFDRQVEKIVAEDMANPVPQIEEAQQSQIEAEFDYKTASAYDISEHAFQKIREYTQSPEDLLEYMNFMSKFPQLSPRNVALIHDQWPGANAVATYDQWKVMGEALGLTPDDVIHTKATYTNKRTGETREVLHQGLSVKTGEKSRITLFRPLMTRMIPVLDENGKQLKNEKGNPKYKKLSEATPQEKALVKEGKLPVKQFQERDRETGQPRFTTYKVFELSQTTLKPESYPKAMPNRHFDFNVDHIKTKEVLDGLCDYAKAIGVTLLQDDAHVLGNAKGAFYPGEQLILLNSNNTPGEKIATTIHELAHATLHNPSLTDSYQAGLPKNQKELEAEMTSHLVSKHFGLDTSEKAFDYLAKWTKNLTALDDQQLTQSFKRIHKTVSQLVKHVEAHTKPYEVRKKRGKQPNFSQAPKKGPSR